MKNFNKNIVWSLLQQFSNYGLSLIITMFMARIILPSEYGIVDLALTVTAFFMIFGDGGIVWSIVREKLIKNEEVINLFWVNTFVGIFLFTTCFFSAPSLSSFYNQPELELVLKWLALTFIITGLSTPYQMWLKRTMEFKKLTLLQFFSTLIGGMIGLYFAYNNYGYWALVILTLSKSSLFLIFLTISSKLPIGFYSVKIKINHLINFGLGLMGFAIVNYFARNLDNVLIGKYLSAEDLAFYAKAYFLMFLPSMLSTGALQGLMVSVLSKYQDNSIAIQKIYSNILRMIFLITLPITGYFLIFPSDPINLFYGSNWTESIILLQLLGIATITQPLYNTMGWIYTAVGKSKEMFIWGILSSTILSISFIIGIFWSSYGIAISYSISMGIIIFLWGLYKAHKIANLSLSLSLKPLIPILISGSISFLFVYLFQLLYSIENLLLSITTKIVILLVIYILSLYTFYRDNLITLVNFKNIGKDIE